MDFRSLNLDVFVMGLDLGFSKALNIQEFQGTSSRALPDFSLHLSPAARKTT